MIGDSTNVVMLQLLNHSTFFSFDLFRFPFASISQYIQRVLCE